MTDAAMTPDRIQRLRRALRWITRELDALDVPFQVAGGLAARAHGASRPLHDIDLYVPEGALEPLRERLSEHVGREPSRHRGEHWDCYFMTVGYGGEQIELAEAPRTRYRRGGGDDWHEAAVDFERPAVREVFGVELPVMPRERLVAYKERIDRPVDRADVAELGGEG